MGNVVVTVALSGADNTGKTKQLGILARRIGPAAMATGPLDAHDARWTAIKKSGMGSWWFRPRRGSRRRAGRLLPEPRPQRRAGLRLMDRGMPMLEASVAATAAVREHLNPDQAADRPVRCWSPTRRT
ncbi:hypothetical protein [Streptomyces sp. BE133]|uniref:hypothetical protein n=1 Tax=Streptomyces sp. BE133 TaxID=3002523 RepID=UPI002E77C1CB|nr:hypothetical protein [Streptomyces sp. BE133]MEE1806458.1 hypothetical protein [Streptomyces sp. BE133]